MVSQIHKWSVPQEVPSIMKLQQRGFLLARTELKEHRASEAGLAERAVPIPPLAMKSQ